MHYNAFRTWEAYLSDFRDSDALCYLTSVLRIKVADSYKQAIETCRVLPYSYRRKIREKADELETKYFPRNYSSTSIRGDYVIVKHAQSKLYGMIDMDGFVVIPCKWNEISYSEGDSYALVGLGAKHSNRLYGIISLETREMIPPCKNSHVEIAGDYLLLVKEDESGDTCQLIRLSDSKIIIDHAAYIETPYSE